MNFIPTAVAGGTNNIVGLYNAYNHVRLASVETDDTVTWSYTTAAFRSCDNSTNNRISFVDGLGQNFIVSPLRGNATIGTGGAAMSESMDSTSAGGGTGVSGNFFFQPSSGTFTASGEMTSYWNPVLGFHYIQCLEFGGPSDVFVGQFRLVMSVEMDD
jgi:hypothetical protein